MQCFFCAAFKRLFERSNMAASESRGKPMHDVKAATAIYHGKLATLIREIRTINQAEDPLAELVSRIRGDKPPRRKAND